MIELPADVWREIYEYLPSLQMTKMRLLSQSHKKIADDLLTQPRMVLKIMATGMDVVHLLKFLEFYRASNAYKRLQKKAKLDSTEALCRAITASETQYDNELRKILNDKPNALLTNVESFLNLVESMFKPNIGGESARIMELVRYFRTTPEFERLHSMKKEEMSVNEVLCYSLTAIDVSDIPLKELNAALAQKPLFTHCIKSLTVTHKVLTQPIESALKTRDQFDTSYVNLPGLKLCNLTLNDINLSGFNLENADFSGSKLNNVTFVYANLQQTNFSTAVIGKTNMSYADLRGSNLGKNELQNAKLTDVRLLYDVTAESLKTFPYSKKILKAMFEDVSTLARMEPENAIAIGKLKLAQTLLPLEPFYKNILGYQIDKLTPKVFKE